MYKTNEKEQTQYNGFRQYVLSLPPEKQQELKDKLQNKQTKK